MKRKHQVSNCTGNIPSPRKWPIYRRGTHHTDDHWLVLVDRLLFLGISAAETAGVYLIRDWLGLVPPAFIW